MCCAVEHRFRRGLVVWEQSTESQSRVNYWSTYSCGPSTRIWGYNWFIKTGQLKIGKTVLLWWVCIHCGLRLLFLTERNRTRTWPSAVVAIQCHILLVVHTEMLFSYQSMVIWVIVAFLSVQTSLNLLLWAQHGAETPLTGCFLFSTGISSFWNTQASPSGTITRADIFPHSGVSLTETLGLYLQDFMDCGAANWLADWIFSWMHIQHILHKSITSILMALEVMSD